MAKTSKIAEVALPSQVLFHTLTHFEKIDDNLRNRLTAEGFTSSEIDSKVSTPGSKFSASFATSPQEVVRMAIQQGEIEWSNNKCTISLTFDRVIGHCALIKESDLTQVQRERIEYIARGDYKARLIRLGEYTPTKECHIILRGSAEEPVLCTLFPGILAPPLPRPGEEADPFWEEYLFID